MAKRIDDPQEMRKRLGEIKKIAVVGLSPKANRPSHGVGKFLMSQGYEVTPVHPAHDEVLGRKAYPSVKEIPGDLEMVDVFRKSSEVLPIAREAIDKGCRLFWMQEGVVNEEAADLLIENGVDVVMDHCPAKILGSA